VKKGIVEEHCRMIVNAMGREMGHEYIQGLACLKQVQGPISDEYGVAEPVEVLAIIANDLVVASMELGQSELSYIEYE